MTNNSLADITAIILAYNEEKHIQRCIQSLKFYIKRIVVIDNYSTDNTLSILKKNNIEVFQNKFIKYAIQCTWGIKISEIKNSFSCFFFISKFIFWSICSLFICILFANNE